MAKCVKAAAVAMLVAALSAPAANVQWDFIDFTSNPQAMRQVFITPTFVSGPVTNGWIVNDRRVFVTGTNGSLVVSNIQAGTYWVQFQGPYVLTSITNNIPNTNGLVNARDLGWNAVIVPGATAQYIIDQARAAANVRAGSNVVVYQDAGATNVINATVGQSFVTNAVFNATNGFSSLVYTNPSTVVYTNNLPAVTNGMSTLVYTNPSTVVYTNQLLSVSNLVVASSNSVFTNLNAAKFKAPTNQPVADGQVIVATGGDSKWTNNSSSGVNVAAGARISTVTNGVVVTVSADQQTNNFSSLVYTNPSTVVYTNQLVGLTNGLVPQSDTNLFARTNDGRVFSWPNTSSVYGGRTTNGVNLGAAFTSAGSASQSEQFGTGALATASSTTALGASAKATNTSSSAFGASARAGGPNTTALGAGAVATANGAVAIGESASATSAFGVVIGGASASVSATSGTAIGSGSTVSAIDGVAIGTGAAVSASDAMAVGASAEAAFANSMAFGSGVTSSAPSQIVFGGVNHYVLFPGNGTIAGVFTNGTHVLTNLYADRAAVVMQVTNNLWVTNAGSVGANGTYVYGSGGVFTNQLDSRWTVNFQTPTWFISSNTVNMYSASAPATTSWTAVNGANPAPASGYGYKLVTYGATVEGPVLSTNITAQIAAAVASLQAGSTTLSNLANTGAFTNAWRATNGIVVTTNSGVVIFSNSVTGGSGSGMATNGGTGFGNTMTNLTATNLVVLGTLSATGSVALIAASADTVVSSGVQAAVIASDGATTIAASSADVAAIASTAASFNGNMSRAVTIGSSSAGITGAVSRAMIGGGIGNTIDFGSGGGVGVAMFNGVSNLYSGGGLQTGAANNQTFIGGRGNVAYRELLWSSSVADARMRDFVMIGGELNVMILDFSKAAITIGGVMVTNRHTNAMVLADGQRTGLTTTDTNQLLIRFQNGVALNTNSAGGSALNVNGTVNATNYLLNGSPALTVPTNGFTTIVYTNPAFFVSTNEADVMVATNVGNQFAGTFNGQGTIALATNLSPGGSITGRTVVASPAGTFTNLSVVSNVVVNSSTVLYGGTGGTNVISIKGSGTAGADGVYTRFFGSLYTNLYGNGFSATNTGPLWAVLNAAGVTVYTTTIIPTNAATTVPPGVNPPPSVEWGAFIDMRSLAGVGEMRAFTNFYTGVSNVAGVQASNAPVDGYVEYATGNQGAKRWGPITALTNTGARVFYVATNGNSSTAIVGNPALPFAADFSLSGGITTLATNAGDVIYILAASNGRPVTITVTNFALSEGVTLTGPAVFPPIVIFSNLQPTLNFEGMITPTNNVVISYIQWRAEETNNPAAFLRDPGAAVTNMWIHHVKLTGSTDVFQGSPPVNSTVLLDDSEVISRWDLVVGSVLTSRNCVWAWIGQTNLFSGATNRASITGVTDYGSTFYRVGGGSLGFGFTGLYGSVFVDSEAFPPTVSDKYGSYYQRRYSANNAVGHYSGVLTALTNGFTTNLVYSYNLTNIYITSGPDANYNAKYTASNYAAIATSGFVIWTNSAGTGYSVRFDDPTALADIGSAHVFSLHHSAGYWTNAVEGILDQSTLGLEWFDPDFNPVSTVGTFGTNSVTTNIFNIYAESLTAATNTTGVITGNGAGLTNATQVYFTNLVSGQLYTNGTTRVIEIQSPQSLTTASISGTCQVDFKVKSGGTVLTTVASVGGQTIVGSLAETEKFFLVGKVPPGWAFCVSNNVSGAGNAAAIDTAATNTATSFP